jgi:hypothetical protein
MIAPSLRWLGLGLSAAVLVVGTHFVWPARAGAGGGSAPATVTYGWLRRPGPRGPNVSVDLYAPPESRRRAPLVVLLQGNEPSQPDERLAFAASVGDSLQRRGVATAAVSFDIHEGYTLRACAAEVAGIVREATGARDATRLVLVGRGLGAWMAAMLALDGRLLEGAGMDPRRVDGVVAIRGTYDLGKASLAGHPDAAFLRASATTKRPSRAIRTRRSCAPRSTIARSRRRSPSCAPMRRRS